MSAAVCLTGLGISLFFAQLGWTRTGIWVFGAVFVSAFALFLWMAKRGADAIISRNIPKQAILAEALAPELGTAPTSAVDLVRQLEELKGPVSFSRELAWAHVDATAVALGSVDLQERLATTRHRRRRWAAIALGGAILWALVLTISLDNGRRRLATMLLDPDAARLSDVPLAGDIRITYRYPAYTGLTPRIVEGGDGSISAVIGTEVEVRATADSPPREAVLRVSPLVGTEKQDIPMRIDGRTLDAKLSVLRDGRYHFAMVTDDGERLEDRQLHPIRALLDTFPEVGLDSPVTDVEIKDDQEVSILWRAKDDFGISEVNLVVEPVGSGETRKLPLSTRSEMDARLEGRYRWAVSELGMEPGGEARFYIEALDNDTTNGPKRGVSPSRRLVLFSARANHEKLLARQQEALNALVDWLGAELVSPFPQDKGPDIFAALSTQERLLVTIDRVASTLSLLVSDLREDKLTKPEYVAAFANILEHVTESHSARLQRLTGAKAARAGAGPYRQLASQQTADIKQIERDVIYLDDLLAIQRIDELKETAKDLLAAQRGLREMLEAFAQTQDPALRAELQRRIAELRQQMIELLAKMAAIKERLPGEYRNLESASMLQVGDQLNRLEKLLREGDLEAAARELEQLANMIENMMDSINSAEEEYGGERYAEIRKELGEFAQEFRELEDQQQAIAKRTEQMLAEYRKKSVQQAGRSLDDFVQKARKKTGEALAALDEVAEIDNLLWTPTEQKESDNARQRLLDLDALLEHRDFAEAREMARDALRHENTLERILDSRINRFGRAAPEPRQAARATREARERTSEVGEMLDKLFPEPSEVMSPKELAQMQRMAQKQQELEQKAGELGKKMDDLAQKLPLFGGQPRDDLEGARQEMGQASRKLDTHALPKASAHEQRAVEQLGRLREALEQASQQSGGQGLPLPLGGGGSGRRSGGGHTPDRRDVEIPKTDPNRGEARFRETLREASKQKPPKQYEEAVQRYYRELIR